MERISFSMNIKAARSIVWNMLWDEITYKEWTKVFYKGSRAVTDWKEGSQVHFLSSKSEGKYSFIFKNIPNEFMSIKHLGVVKNGIELPFDEETNKIAGAMENYSLKEKDGYTELTVELDTDKEYLDYFNETFPKALNKVRALCEN